MRRLRPCTSRLAVRSTLFLLLGVAAVAVGPARVVAEQAPPRQPEFANGFPADEKFFPIGVWLQNTRNAAAFSAIGINTYIGLWQGPTEDQLAELGRLGLHAIVEPAPKASSLPSAHVIRAWLQADEPDNAQPDGRGGYGDCILPEEVVRRYQGMRQLDATRPVFLNFGQAVANPAWFGRGAKCGRIAPEAYYRPASRGADIVAFDIYPAAEEQQAHVKGKLELVGKGVANLKQWTQPGQPVWTAIETTHITSPSRRPLPHEVRSEAWMALIHGSNGIFYFVHEWQPSFREDGVFRYPDTVREIARVNEQIRKLAPVLNAPTLPQRVSVQAGASIVTMMKRYGEANYVFAVNMENKPAKARLMLTDVGGPHALVLGEDRLIELGDRAIADEFEAYGVHLYKIPDKG